MSNWFTDLLSKCFGRERTQLPSTPSIDWSEQFGELDLPENRPPPLPLYDPFNSRGDQARSGHCHLTYTDCTRIHKQVDIIYPYLKKNPELIERAHCAKAHQVNPSDLIAALTYHGYEVEVRPTANRQRVSHECDHPERCIVPGLIGGEFMCLACADLEIAREAIFQGAHLRVPPLGVRSPLE